MEVWMRNVPAHLTDQTLKTHLKEKISAIGVNEWHCNKQRGQSHATVTFIDTEDGAKFLRQYGEVVVPGYTRNGQPKSHGQLSLLGTMVYCKESKHEPEVLVLKVLEKNMEDRAKTKDLEQEINTNARMPLTSLACGHYEYPNDRLTYMIDMNICNFYQSGIIKFAKHMLIVTYPESKAVTVRLEIPYRIIEEIVVSTKPRAITVTLWESPRFFINTETDQQMARSGQERFKLTRNRITHLSHSIDHSKFVGQSLVYQFVTSSTDLHHKMKKISEDKSLFCREYKSLSTQPSLISMGDAMTALSRTLGQVDRNIPFEVAYQFYALAQGGYLLPQTVRALILRVEKSAVDAARSDGSYNVRSFCPVSAAAVKKLFLVDFAGPGIEAATFQVDNLWNQLLQYEKDARMELSQDLISDRASQSMVSVFKVQVTPTRLLFSGPELEPNNRVLRKYSEHTEYFARLQLCEEDGQDIFFNPGISMDTVWERYRSVLKNGVQICGRVYKFLGFSHSSLRAHAVWVMASFYDSRIRTSRNYFNVISELGAFKKIFSPARRAARIGQAFSDTRVSIPLSEQNVTVQMIPDIKSADGSRVFSDGVGTISRGLLEVIQDYVPPKMGQATCFQIRWAGAKGMLSLDDTLPGLIMRIRPESMIKFDSTDTQNLELCDAASKPTPLVLNRQMIKILEDMGVPEDWFLKEQVKEVSRLRKITSDVNNTVTFLRRQKIGDQMRFSQFMRKLHELGLDYKTDRFLCTVVEAVVLRELRLLKNKARIPVDKGVTLFGVMDEFGFLAEHEVFVAFDGLDTGHYLDLHGRLLIVTRSPALYPGDIQICRNIIPPEDHPLRSLRNCVIFSQKGRRDLPSQLSGGDLDGDKYNIIWDETAVTHCTRISAPADYPRVPPLDLGREVEISDMIDFFVQFMATDQLGLIATRHMIYADQKDDGTLDDVCKELARIHSTAVDYSKTGVPVDMQELRGLGTPRYRPDFMAPTPLANIRDRSEIAFDKPMLRAETTDEDDDAGPQFAFYKSDKVLGKLFRSIDERRIWEEDIQIFSTRKGITMWERLARFLKHNCDSIGGINWQGSIPDANKIYDTYNDALWALTVDFSESAGAPITEVELFTGHIFNSRGLPTKRQGERSLQLKEEFDRITRWIESLIRKHKMGDYIEDEEGYDEHFPSDHEPRGKANGSSGQAQYQASAATPLELSLACLHVATSRPTQPSRKSRRSMANGNFESFKVVAAACSMREFERTLHRHRYSRDYMAQAAKGTGRDTKIRVADTGSRRH